MANVIASLLSYWYGGTCQHMLLLVWGGHCIHQGREIIAIVPLENGAICTVFSENFHKF
jgi:hypothetical protein